MNIIIDIFAIIGVIAVLMIGYAFYSENEYYDGTPHEEDDSDDDDDDFTVV